MNLQTLVRTAAKRPYLVVGLDHAYLADASEALLAVRHGRFVMGLAEALANFRRLAKGQKRFLPDDLMKVTGRCRATVNFWIERAGIVPTIEYSGDEPRRIYEIDELGAFIAGLAGSMSRWRLPWQSMRAASLAVQNAARVAQDAPVEVTT